MEDRKGEVEKASAGKEGVLTEEQSWYDVWKFTKDPWRTKESMKDLKDDDRDQCESDNEGTH